MNNTPVHAIRSRGLGRYVGAPVEMDGALHPGEAWRTLLRIAGLRLAATAADDVLSTVSVPGQLLRDVSIDVEAGSAVCLAGSAESATALLEILAGMVPPTNGSVELSGEVTSLLTPGGRLNNRISGYENILASPRVADWTSRDVEAFAADVVAFAELQGAEHASVRTYSTGMTLRLGAALALCGRPSIVLIDDVLAVGDIAFQQKCLDRVLDLKQAGATLVLGIRDATFVRQVATRVLTFADGRVAGDSAPGDWMAKRHVNGLANVEWEIAGNLPEDDAIALRSVAVEAGRDVTTGHLDVALEFQISVAGRWRPSVFLEQGKTVVFRSVYSQFVAAAGPTRLRYTVRVPIHDLTDGAYALGISMSGYESNFIRTLKARGTVTLTVRRQAPEDVAPGDGHPLLAPTWQWEVDRVTQQEPA